jgi:hypothetical protein
VPPATSPATCRLASRLGREAKTTAARSATAWADGATSAPVGDAAPGVSRSQAACASRSWVRARMMSDFVAEIVVPS